MNQRLKQSMTLRENISQVIVGHVLNRYGSNVSYANRILSAVKKLLGITIQDYKLPKKIVTNGYCPRITEDNFQETLSKINEKGSRQKKDGVYYTDPDVTDFLAANTLLHYVSSGERSVYGLKETQKKIDKLGINQKEQIVRATVLDPTCGAGEFLLSILSIKIYLFKKLNGLKYEDIAKTIFGNDIDFQSTEITKLRVFFLLIDSFEGILSVDEIADNINHNFSNIDAVVYDNKTFGCKDIVIGNPPYVEYRNFEGTPQLGYGNVYADVLHHSIDILSNDGIMAFVIPLSYVSTIRMSKIREYISNKSEKQIIMNFADRPDSLFSCVHQKLSIIIAQKSSDFKGVLTSSYHYWYQSERQTLFDNISLAVTVTDNNAYWPKVGNNLDVSIYNKFLKVAGKDILSYKDGKDTASLYINQRGCFWMKVFTKDMHSNSYAIYTVPKKRLPFVFCLVNSSLFFLLWIIISDGWHITNKELSFIKIPTKLNNLSVWERLMVRLENRLEQTKVFVGTAQVDYEYKHKECKDIIDEIDDEIAKVYHLSSTQLNYVKNFGLKYRLGNGA